MIFTPELLAQTLIAGVMIGVIYALMALGITFIYSIVKMINWAMGEFYMIGSFVQYGLIVYFLGPDLWWVAVPLSAATVFLLGVLLEPILIKPMFTSGIERKDDYATVVTPVMDCHNISLVCSTKDAVVMCNNAPARVRAGDPPLVINGVLLPSEQAIQAKNAVSGEAATNLVVNVW
jgi:hypothetical protein